ncbi:MAG TPA: NADH-quinone oxidoreductase subunit K [Candidatus Aquilonibacter sp.]|nr:NADH-quinone oxidoreductase subunit K [Candidatus Aquilonibacter sp.]
MLPLNYFTEIGAIFLALGIAGAVASRHFVITILSLELVFAGAIIALVGFFAYSSLSNGEFFVILLSIWAVASTEIVGLVAFYVYMKGKVSDFDLKRLMQLKG